MHNDQTFDKPAENIYLDCDTELAVSNQTQHAFYQRRQRKLFPFLVHHLTQHQLQEQFFDFVHHRV